MSRYLNPYTDFGFKKLFGQEGSKDLLMDFLNEILPARHRVTDLTFKVPEDLPEIAGARKAVFDIFCHSPTGERFIVEMQKAEQRYFKDRSVFYSTFPIRAQALRGVWNFKLAPVYCIGILDFIFDEDEASEDGADTPENLSAPLPPRRRGRGEHPDDLLTVSQLKDQFCRVFYDKLTFAFIEMPRFKLSGDELTTHLHKWLYFLKNLETFESIPGILREAVFEKGFHIAELAAMTAEEREAYEQSLKHYRDIVNVVDTAEQKGYTRGLAEHAGALASAQAEAEKERSLKETAEAAAKEERRLREEAVNREREALERERALAEQLRKLLEKSGAKDA